MVKQQIAFIGTLLLCSVCLAQKLPQSVALWPNGAPGSEGQTSPEVTTQRVEPTTATVDGLTIVAVSNVNNPSITPFLPNTPNGAAVIIAPGGGHQFLAIEHEGYAVARVLADHGVAAFVLKYRLAKSPGSTYKVEVHSLMDIQRAVRTVRANAVAWKINPNHVGIMGFSAGGELALMGATRYLNPVPGSNDAVDHLSCRPDFAALIYPGGNPGSMELPDNMPPEFLACAYNDKPATNHNVVQLYTRMKEKKIPVELHIYGSGGHGFGVRPASTRPANEWPELFVDWLGDLKLVAN